MLRVYNNVRLADPFLQPFWRHERVLAMLAAWPPERCKRYDDEWIRGYRSYLFDYNKGGSKRIALLYENPGLYYAHNMFVSRLNDPEMSLVVEARLLAGMSYEEIAEENKTIPETIQWYEKLFFNVKDFLRHSDWILRNVLIPASDRFVDVNEENGDDKKPKFEIKPHFDMTLKFFAYYGGPLLCDFMLSGFKKGVKVERPDEIESWLDTQWSNQIRRKSAQAAGQFRVNSFNVMELFVVHAKLLEIQQRVDDKQARHNEFEKHVNAMLPEIPWTVGDEGKKLYADTPLGQYDEQAAELDSSEVMAVGAGRQINAGLQGVDESIFRRTEIKDGKPK